MVQYTKCAKPKVIAIKPVQTKQLPQKFAKDDMELAKIREEGIRKSLEKNLPKKSKDDLELLKDLRSFKGKDKLYGHKVGEKVKIFNKDNLKQFVEISWPKEATAYNVVESVVRIMVH